MGYVCLLYISDPCKALQSDYSCFEYYLSPL